MIPVREVKFFIVISLQPTQQPFKDLYCGGIAHYTTTKDTKNSSSHKLIFAWVFEEMEEELLSGVCFVGGRFHFLPSKRCLWFLSCNIQNFVCLLLRQEAYSHYTTKDTKDSSSHKLIFMWVFEEMEEELLSGVCFVAGHFHFFPSKRCLWFLSCNIQNFVCLLLTQEAYNHCGHRAPDKEAFMLALVINKSTSPDLYIVLVPTLWLVKMYEAKEWRTPVDVQNSLPRAPNDFKF